MLHRSFSSEIKNEKKKIAAHYIITYNLEKIYWGKKSFNTIFSTLLIFWTFPFSNIFYMRSHTWSGVTWHSNQYTQHTTYATRQVLFTSVTSINKIKNIKTKQRENVHLLTSALIRMLTSETAKKQKYMIV